MKPVADTTPKGQTETIVFEIALQHAPAKVWRTLTEPALLAEWLLPVTGLALEPGTPFSFKRDPLPGWDGVVNCTMLEVEPLKKIRYAWVVGDLDTVVTFTLAPTPTGTQLTLVHSGFQPTQKQNFGGARYGWTHMGGTLVELLARTS